MSILEQTKNAVVAKLATNDEGTQFIIPVTIAIALAGLICDVTMAVWTCNHTKSDPTKRTLRYMRNPGFFGRWRLHRMIVDAARRNRELVPYVTQLHGAMMEVGGGMTEDQVLQLVKEAQGQGGAPPTQVA